MTDDVPVTVNKVLQESTFVSKLLIRYSWPPDDKGQLSHPLSSQASFGES